MSIKFELILILLLSVSLSGCGILQSTTPTPLPTIVLGNNQSAPQPPSAENGSDDGVTASGIVVPAREAEMASRLGGNVKAVVVVVGDQVKAGQLLLKLGGSEKLHAAVDSANVELIAAQQALDDLYSRAAVDKASAMEAVALTNREVRDTQYLRDNFLVPTSLTSLDPVQAVNLTKQNLDEARQAFEPWKFKSELDSTRRDLKEKLDLAQSEYNASVRWLEIEVALSQAEARLEKAVLDYELVKDGPDPARVKAAEARIKAAQGAIDSSQSDLDELELTAPFDGTVGKLNFQVGDWVMPGQTILVFAELDHLRVETTDLSERDVPLVKLGQPVTVFIEALNEQVSGTVSEISPLADRLGGDVVYQTIIDLDTIPAGLLPGMSVEVKFGSG